MAAVLAVILLALGEGFSIIAELYASKHATDLWHAFLISFALITVAGALLLAGYMYGYVHLKNMWIVTAISIASIAVIEPLLIVLWFQEVPTRGAIIGLILGALGILASVVIV